MSASLSAMSYFMPIFAFFLVFIVIYALLVKTKVLGGSHGIMVFISFILAGFFIVEASLVEFIQFSSAWFVVGIMAIFFIVLLLGFIPGIELGQFLGAKNWFAWVLLGLVFAFFIISSAYVFNWALNWGVLRDWFNTDWFGMILLLVIAAVVSWKIKG
jgi:hypothetical protein